MLNPHAILLKESNYPEIIHWTHADLDCLKSDLEESVEQDMPYYVVFKRTKEGWPLWYVYTMVELCVEYRLPSVKDRFVNSFERI